MYNYKYFQCNYYFYITDTYIITFYFIEKNKNINET